MEAMEIELKRARLAKEGGTTRLKGAMTSKRRNVNTTTITDRKGKEKVQLSQVSDDEDFEAAMDAELRAALEQEEGDSGAEEPMDYGLIKNFLESFKSQAGLAGPVSSLAGRLEPGWSLPRDSS